MSHSTVCEQIRAELESIRKAHRGLLRPEDVVDFARGKKTALHAQFTWDDGTAAREFRLWQARQVIIACVTVVDRPGGSAVETRAYVSLTDDRQSAGGGYRRVEDVMSDPARRAALLKTALAELQHFRQKYTGLAALEPVFKAINKVGRAA